jgi:uncharacterized protein YkwD
VISSAQLHHARRAVIGLVLAATFVVAAPASASSLESAVLRDINAVRASHGLRAVHASRGLAAGARSYSHRMAAGGFFGHGSWVQRIRRHTHSRTIGEILGYVQSVSRAHEARAIVNAWMHSAEHRAIILGGRFHRAGVGRGWAHWGGRRTAIYTVDFAG